MIASLGNFGKPEPELETPEDEWLYLLKNLEFMNDVPARYKERKEFTELMDNAEWAKLSPRDRDRYDAFYLEYTLRISQRETLKRMVTEQVTERMVLKMKAKGRPDEEIAEVADLPLERVRAIIASAG